MKTFSEITEDLKAICTAFKLGELKGYKTENHTVPNYKKVIFETSNGIFKYLYLIK